MESSETHSVPDFAAQLQSELTELFSGDIFLAAASAAAASLAADLPADLALDAAATVAQLAEGVVLTDVQIFTSGPGLA